MFAITGITGKVGGAAALALRASGKAVRAVVRDAAKGAAWQDRGCTVALAEMTDAAALTAAFRDAEGVFILPPPDFDPAPGYPGARRVIDAVVSALDAARPARVVCLSTVGADAEEDNLLTQRRLMEQALAPLDLPITFLRPGWFLDNVQWDLEAARREGVFDSFLQPADRGIPMVAAQDVGTVAADLLLDDWSGHRVIGLEGPAAVTPRDIADALGRAFGKPIDLRIVPRDTWEALFRSQGMQHPLPRMRMLDGFNEGWIGFGDSRVPLRRGKTTLDGVISALVG